ncbi:MAG: transposase [Myxococcota bacterium]|nr:transposase [Myxococcota bacterium]
MSLGRSQAWCAVCSRSIPSASSSSPRAATSDGWSRSWRGRVSRWSSSTPAASGASAGAWAFGVAPFARDSGTLRGPRRIRGGRASVRTVLYLAAMTGARFNPVLRELYERLRQAGKPPKLAFIAVARKLLTILNAMARERTAWKA